MRTLAVLFFAAVLAWPQRGDAFTVLLYDDGETYTWEGTTYPSFNRTEADPINWADNAHTALEYWACCPHLGEFLPPIFWDSADSVVVSFWAGAETADMETWRQNFLIEDAIDEWNDNLDSISISYAGNNILEMDQNDGKNVIAFGDWDDFGTNVGGRTLLVVKTGTGSDAGELIDADIVLNDGDFDWPFTGSDCSASPKEQDIQSIVTHELGHAIGIGHTKFNSEYRTMMAGACCDDPTKCENNDWRSLETDDINAGKEIYGPGGNGGSDSTWVRGETGGNGTPKPVSSATAVVLPQGNRILGAYPNPFNPSTLIAFELDRPGEVALSVYNMAGQLITDLLHNAQLSAGSHQVAWDPGNREVASGVYLVRLEGVDWVSTKKIGLIR